MRAWAPGVAQMRAIDASSLPASVRHSRSDAVVERTSFRAIAACAGPFATYAKAIEKVNDDKRGNRVALLEGIEHMSFLYGDDIDVSTPVGDGELVLGDATLAGGAFGESRPVLTVFQPPTE